VLRAFLSENILGRASAQTATKRGRLFFGSYLTGAPDSFLFQVLGHLTRRRPWNYWDRDVFQAALATLEADPIGALQSLHTHRKAIDTGLKEWLRDVPASQDERPISFPSTEDLIRIATLHHPEYLRRAEHIFGNVLHLFWGVLKKKSVAGAFELRSALAVLNSRCQNILATGYRDDIRNGIAHGQVVFTGSGILYGPESGNVELLASDLLHELDRLWMTCNSLVLALVVFVGGHLELLGTDYVPPSRLAVLFSEVNGRSWCGHRPLPLFAPGTVYIIRKKGVLELGSNSCAGCHTRLLPDRTSAFSYLSPVARKVSLCRM
jgi:hypothetical protein